MNPYYFLLILTIISCGGKSSRIDFGKTTEASLLADKGEPTSEEEIQDVGKVLVYPKDQKFQIEKEIVTNEFRRPQGDEVNLIYWKHKFKDCATSSEALPHKQVGHEAREFEFKCPEKGLSVIHADGAEKILRVREYAKE